MADRALGALAAAFGSAAVEGRLLRAGVIIRKGPHRDGAPETHSAPRARSHVLGANDS